MSKRLLLVLLIIIPAGFIFAQDFIWPTDASHYLTSSFAEYRSGHFHAGIDIKTWGREGYRVFAVKDGYIWRIRVSPFGYGKVIYQKLYSGEIIVYAHLQHFNDQLEKIVKREQKRRGEYRIDKTFRPGALPVKQGDLIAYTGSTGIGVPHLHFEIRDPQNRPTNPFLYGYHVKDSIPPKISAFSITPLTAKSRVNSDVKPLILKPQLISPGDYKITEKLQLFGKIGFAIACYDQANGVRNTFAVYRLIFYVDGELKFSALYNKFSYNLSSLIDLDRDYRLKKRSYGLFQKLYKEEQNNLPFYKPTGDTPGIIDCLPGSNPGVHNFRVELYDFNGNRTVLHGEYVIGKKKQIYATVEHDLQGNFYLTDIYDEQGNSVVEPQIFIYRDLGRTWTKYQPFFYNSFNDSLLLMVNNEIELLKITSNDNTFPYFTVLTANDLITTAQPVDFKLEKDFYDDFVRLQLSLNGLVKEKPRLYVQQVGLPPTEVELIQYDLTTYVGVYELVPGKDGPLDIEAYTHDFSGKELIFWDQFDIRTVTPQHGGQIISKDDKCKVIFGANAVYKNLFLRINEATAIDTNSYEFVGSAYNIEPHDVPLKRSATVYLKYPDNDPRPDKLGVYGSYNRKKWSYTGGKLNQYENIVSSRLSSLRFVTLIRDTIPPEIVIRSPRNFAHIRNKYPIIQAMVRDRLSGIASERSIIVKLDGKKVIAEYDPEKRTITYEVEEALSAGKHTVEVWAIDNSKNKRSVTSVFTVL